MLISTEKLKRIRIFLIAAILPLILTGCEGIAVVAQVKGATGTLELTNNGTGKIVVIEDGLYVMKDKLHDGYRYRVEVVPGSDTGQGHQCVVTGGSNNDGSGRITNGQSVLIMVNCHPV